MAYTEEGKAKLIQYINSQGGSVDTSDPEYKRLQAAAIDQSKEVAGTTKTTSGLIKDKNVASYEKAIQSGGSGSQYIEAPPEYAQYTQPELTASDQRMVMTNDQGQTVNVNVNDTARIADLRNKGFDKTSDYTPGTTTLGEAKAMAPGADDPATTLAAPSAAPVGQSDTVAAARQIRDIYGQLQTAQEAQIDEATGQAISGYEEQIGTVGQEAQALRSAQDVRTARQQQSMRERAAATGQAYTGGAASDVIGAEAAGQQAKTAYTVQEQNLISSLKRAISDAQRSGELQKIASAATLGAQEASALMSADTQAAQLALQEAGLTGQYQGQETMAAQQLRQSNEQWAQQFGLSLDQWETQKNQWDQQFQESLRQADLANGQWWAAFQADKEKADWNRQMDLESLKLAQNEFAWATSPDNPNNIQGTLATDMGFTGAAAGALDHIFENVIPAQVQTVNQYDEAQKAQFYDDLNGQIYATIMAWPGLSEDDQNRLLTVTIQD